MTDAEAQEALTALYRRIFSAPGFQPADGMTGREIPNWDSMTYISFLVELQKVFRIRIGALEAGQIRTVGDVRALLSRKLAEQGGKNA